MPALCILVNDNPEGKLMALMYNSAKAKCPCRMCKWVSNIVQFFQTFCWKNLCFLRCENARCKGVHFNDPNEGLQSPFRTTAETSASVDAVKRLKRGKPAAAKKLSSKVEKFEKHWNFEFFVTVHLEESGFRGIWWGSNPHRVHLAAGPDGMHLILEGLGRHLMSYISTVVKKAGGQKDCFLQ